MLVVLETDICTIDAPVLLHVDLARPVHHDLGDCIVVEQWLDRTEAENLRDDGLEEASPVLAVQDDALLAEDAVELLLNDAPYLGGLREVQLGVQLGDQRILHLALQIEEAALLGRRASPGGGVPEQTWI